jgi:hypothetical protein
MADLVTYLGSADTGKNYKAKAKVSAFGIIEGNPSVCIVHFILAEGDRVTVKCDVAKGASKYLGIKSDGEGKSFKVEMKKPDTYLQVGITNLNEESLTYYYWNFTEAGSSLILSPGDDMTKGYPTLTITPEGASTKIVRTGGDLAFKLLDEVIISPN